MTKSPGKFEGEPDYVEHFWNHLDEADEERSEGDRAIAAFRIGPEDHQRWPDLESANWLELWEDDQGFVHHRLVHK